MTCNYVAFISFAAIHYLISLFHQKGDTRKIKIGAQFHLKNLEKFCFRVTKMREA